VVSEKETLPEGERKADLARRARSLGYSEVELKDLPESALASLGCGSPAALAELREGEVVLDLGSGCGLDALLAARRAGPQGRVIGVDLTPEMVQRSRRAAAEAQAANVEFRIGQIERLPVDDASVDVVLSNCVMNHCRDKVAAFREARRVLRPGGRMLVSDLVVEGEVPPLDRNAQQVWGDWLAVAAGKADYLRAIRRAGFRKVKVVSEHLFESPAMVPALEGRIVSLSIRASG
jgi:SAM-dependent methyltransferase